MNPIIDIVNLNKSFGKRKVLHDLSFQVNKGEVFAFLGANGSGKTTTIRCLLGIYQPDSGELTIDGKTYNPSMSSLLGYLPEERGLYTSSSVLETMIFFGEVKGLSYGNARQNALDYLERVGLTDKVDTKIGKLSSGQQQKIQLGITIINKPQLLILDEPTKGLDPVNRSLLLDILDELNKQGSTILFSTHQMEEVERIADRLVMIKDGQRELYGEIGKIKQDFGGNRVVVNFSGKLPENPKLYSIEEQQRNHAILSPGEKVTPQDILQYLAGQKLNITKFEVSLPSLNEIFIKTAAQQTEPMSRSAREQS